jgi:hypothetical protein
MFARLLALCSLLTLVVSPGRTGSNVLTGPDLVVYLKSDSAQPPRPLEYMKVELSALLLPAGYRLEWRESTTSNRNVENAELLLVELRGTCGLPGGRLSIDTADATGSLASTFVSGNRVLPFSWLNCESLTRLIAHSLASEPGARRDYLYGRAMARLLAHEVYHVVANTKEHGRAGIAKAAFTTKDLLSERFAFEPVMTAKPPRRNADSNGLWAEPTNSMPDR